MKELLASVASVKCIVSKHHGEESNFLKLLKHVQGELRMENKQSMHQTRIIQFFRCNKIDGYVYNIHRVQDLMHCNT